MKQIYKQAVDKSWSSILLFLLKCLLHLSSTQFHIPLFAILLIYSQRHSNICKK